MFEKQRLSDNNLSQYIGNKTKIPKLVPRVPCLLQKDYGDLNDCTLTSITAIIKFYNPTLNVQNIYDSVYSIAKMYGYTGSYGTPTITMGTIYNKVLKQFDLNKKAQCYIGKNVGYNFVKIQNEINSGRPILLNLWKDGRNYYKNHSVLIIGYIADGNRKFLAVYDNWNPGISYIDYTKLCVVSNIFTLRDI